MRRDGVVDTVPHTLCRLVLVQRAPDNPLLVSLGLVITHTHRNPAPARRISRLVAYLHDALVLNGVAVLAGHVILAARRGANLHIADTRHRIRKLTRIEQNWLILSLKPSPWAPMPSGPTRGPRQRLLV